MLRLAYAWKLIARVPCIRLLRGEKNREFVLSHVLEPRYLAELNQPFEPAKGAKYGYLALRSLCSIVKMAYRCIRLGSINNTQRSQNG